MDVSKLHFSGLLSESFSCFPTALGFSMLLPFQCQQLNIYPMFSASIIWQKSLLQTPMLPLFSPLNFQPLSTICKRSLLILPNTVLCFTYPYIHAIISWCQFFSFISLLSISPLSSLWRQTNSRVFLRNYCPWTSALGDPLKTQVRLEVLFWVEMFSQFSVPPTRFIWHSVHDPNEWGSKS